MELFLLLIRIALSALFATAGFAKLADLQGSKKAFREFGIPASAAGAGSIALSIFEITLAAMFLFADIAWYAAIGAAGLLLLFIVQMIYQRAKGNAPDCHCFGQLHSEPVSVKSILRNAVFFALVLVPLVRGVRGQGLEVTQLTVESMPTVLGTAAIIMLAAALLYLRKIVASQDDLRRRIDVLEVVSRDGTAVDHEHVQDPQLGLPIGSPLPSFELTDLQRRTVTKTDLVQRGKGILLIFVSPTCEPCQAILPNLTEWSSQLSEKVETYFVSSGSESENRKKFSGLDPARVLLDAGRRFALGVGGRWTPTALYIDRNGKIGSHVAAGDVAIEDLIDKLKKSDLAKPFIFFANADHHGRGLKMGTEAPDFKLSDIDGDEFGKDDLVGSRTLLTFWSPTCPHCEAFLDEFKQWVSSRSNGDPKVVLISDGDQEEHRALGLDSPVVLDKGYRTSVKLGMFGTPSAVLVNEQGIIETETAVGADNIWALLGRKNETN